MIGCLALYHDKCANEARALIGWLQLGKPQSGLPVYPVFLVDLYESTIGEITVAKYISWGKNMLI